MSRPVVIGYDGSAGARRAVEWGASYAERHAAPVHILRAYEPFVYDLGRATGATVAEPPARDADAMIQAAWDQLEELASAVWAAHPGLQVAFAVERTDAEEALVRASLDARTVVLGSRGMSAFSTLLAGSTTMHVATHAHCSVIAVPEEISGGPGLGHQVVVGVDGSELSRAALAFAFQEASDTGSPLVAVHAWLDPALTAALGPALPPVDDPATVSAGHDLLLAESLAGWSEKYPDVRVTRRVVHAHPVPALLESAEGARMLVVGSRGHGAVRSLLLGSVGHGLLHLARCPVAIVREQRHG
jgi:nucleotide-binding universal stress UspA family protein